MTAAAERLYDALVAYYLNNGFPPSLKDLGKVVGHNSSSTTLSQMQRLEAAGWVRRGLPNASSRVWLPVRERYAVVKVG